MELHQAKYDKKKKKTRETGSKKIKKNKNAAENEAQQQTANKNPASIIGFHKSFIQLSN